MAEESGTMAASPTAMSVSARPAINPEVLVLRIVYIIATRYSWILIVGVGLFGNFMSIIITLQENNRRISTCNYMTALALADSGVLVAQLVWGIFLHIWETNPPTEFDMQ
jgi:hypothetical protein